MSYIESVKNHCIEKNNFFSKKDHEKPQEEALKRMDELNKTLNDHDEKYNVYGCDDEYINKKGHPIKNYFVLQKGTAWIYTKKGTCHLNEMIREGAKCKMYFDIDMKDIHPLPKQSVKEFNRNKKREFDKIIIELMNKINYYIKSKNTDIDLSIIVLTSHAKSEEGYYTKLSAHIIYENVHVNNNDEMRHFVQQMKLKEDELELSKDLSKSLDENVYTKNRLFRCMLNTKIDKNIKLVYTNEYDDLTNYEYINDKKCFNDSLICNIDEENSYLFPVDNYVKKLKAKKQKIIKEKEIIDGKERIVERLLYDYPIKTIQKYANIISAKMFDKYIDWFTIGSNIFNCNSTDEGLKLWIKLSKRSKKYSEYEVEISCKNKWQNFNYYDAVSSFHYIKKLAQIANPKGYNQISIKDSFNIDEESDKIEINCEYLLGLKDKIKKTDSVLCKNIHKWVTDSDIKTLVLNSSYGSGKTVLLKKLYSEYNIKNILMVTFRVSLANEIQAVFHAFDFDSYLNDCAFNVTNYRYICSIDSIQKIKDNKYDLIVMDELESNLYQFHSSTMKNNKPYENFQILFDIIKKSEKLVCLDGDVGKRGLDYIKNFGNYIYMSNKMVKNTKIIKIVDDGVHFYNKIHEAIMSKKKIVIASQSATKLYSIFKKYSKDKDHYLLKDFKSMFNDPSEPDELDKPDDEPDKEIENKKETKTYNNFNVVMHTSKSDDKIKQAMKDDLNELWENADILLYSPTISAGVSFDKTHFDLLFVILSQKSCHARDLIQMMCRVRKFGSNEVLIFTNKLKYNPLYDYKFATFDDFSQKIMNDLYQDQNKKVEMLPYYINYIHNEVEKYNSNEKLFIATLIKDLRLKGHEVKFCSMKYGDGNESDIDKLYSCATKKLLMQALPPACIWDNLSLSKIDELQQTELTMDEKMSITRHYAIIDLTNSVDDKRKNVYCKQYKTLCEDKEGNKDEIKKLISEENEILESFYNKIYYIKNFRTLTRYTDETLRQTFSNYFNTKHNDGTTNHKKLMVAQKLNTIEGIMKLFNFSISNNTSNIVESTVFKNIAQLLNMNSVKSDFELNDLTQKNICETINGVVDNTCKNYRAFIGLINSILGCYCLKIERKQTSTRVNKKVTMITKYEIKRDNQYCKLIDIIMKCNEPIVE
jgi:hypothetical protein